MRGAAIAGVTGGILLAASFFLPPGHERAPLVVVQEAWDSLSDPDSEGLSAAQIAFYSAEVLALTYPIGCAVAAVLAVFYPASRALALCCFTFHGLALLALAGLSVAVGALIYPRMHGAAALFAALLAWEIAALVRALRGPCSAAAARRVNLPPLIFLFLLNAGVGVYFWLRPHNYPVASHLTAGAGALFILAAYWLRGAPQKMQPMA